MIEDAQNVLVLRNRNVLNVYLDTLKMMMVIVLCAQQVVKLVLLHQCAKYVTQHFSLNLMANVHLAHLNVIVALDLLGLNVIHFNLEY